MSSALGEKINRRLINNCKETVLCYNLSYIIIIDDNFRYSMTSLTVRTPGVT